MTAWARTQYNKHPFTWFTVVGTLNETLETIQEFYDELVAEYEYDNETGDTSSPFYGWELRKENIEVSLTFGFEGLSIILYPRFVEQPDYFEGGWNAGFGESSYVATVDDVGGRPSYSEFVKVVEYLLRPIADKVNRVDYSEVEEYCRGGKGYIVFTESDARYRPLKEEMKAMGLVTPENFLEQQGYFGPR